MLVKDILFYFQSTSTELLKYKSTFWDMFLEDYKFEFLHHILQSQTFF